MSDWATLRKWFDEFEEATGEVPSRIVFGEWEGYRREFREQEWGVLPVGVTRFVDVPDAVLDHEFDDGFGGNEAPNFCAWSESWVLFCDNYDGREDICWVPRNPVAHNPIRPGGG